MSTLNTDLENYYLENKQHLPRHIRSVFTQVDDLTAYWLKRGATEVGKSALGRPILAYTCGNGPTHVLVWAQMHGNESTGQRAFTWFLHLHEKESWLLSAFTIAFIPLLNPDGALLFQRRNALGIDLNRDARAQQTPEIKALVAFARRFNPKFAFNLHDQRSIFTAESHNRGAALSLAIPNVLPTIENHKYIESNRNLLRTVVAKAVSSLSKETQTLITQFDESYYPTALGEYFQEQGISTLLIESGMLGLDFNRNISTAICSNFLHLLFRQTLSIDSLESNTIVNMDLGPSLSNLRDILCRNVKCKLGASVITCDFSFQYLPQKENGIWQHRLYCDDIGDLRHLNGRIEPVQLELDMSNFQIEIGKPVVNDLCQSVKAVWPTKV